MAVCMRCGEALPAPSGMLGSYMNRGSFWLVVALMTVSLWAVGLGMGMITSFFESESPYPSKLALALALGAIRS